MEIRRETQQPPVIIDRMELATRSQPESEFGVGDEEGGAQTEQYEINNGNNPVIKRRPPKL